MKNHKLINNQSIADNGQSSPKLRPRRWALYAFLAMTAIVVLAGCVSDGYYGGSYGYPGYYRSGGYYGYRGPYHSGGYHGGGFHRGPSFGTQHGFGHGGFGGGRIH